MTSVAGLEVSIFTIPLDIEGKQLISQQCGYFHLWRFLNSDGSVSLDGEIGATFGGQWDNEAIPFGYNSKLSLAVPVDRILIEWAAQPNKVAQILLTKDPRGLDGQNTPAKQLVIPQGAGFASNSTATIGTTAAQIIPANSSRSRAILQSDPANTSNISLGIAGVTAGTGLVLVPGAAYEWRGSNACFGIAGAAGQVVRIIQESY